jgi:Domain of unknown function (DUF4136)
MFQRRQEEMKRLLQGSMLMLLLGATVALAQDVRYNFDKSADFTKYKTYKFVPIKGATEVNDIVDKQIKTEIESQLSQKGMTKVDGDNADLLIGYQTAIGQEKQFTSYDSGGWGYGPGWGRGGWYGGGGGGMTTGQTSTIYTGQIAIDMYDSAQKDLVWRGVVSKTIDTKAKPEKQQKNLTKALTKLFKKYPPEVKS